MRFNPTENGGRILEGVSPWGKFRVEWDAAGKLVSESLELKTPPETPAQIEARLAREGYDPATVKRGGCCDPPIA